jgi:hypothetical protein
MTLTESVGLPEPVNRPASTRVWGLSETIDALLSPSPLSEFEHVVPAAMSRTE